MIASVDLLLVVGTSSTVGLLPSFAQLPFGLLSDVTLHRFIRPHRSQVKYRGTAARSPCST
jgi:hypothetical protein